MDLTAQREATGMVASGPAPVDAFAAGRLKPHPSITYGFIAPLPGLPSR